MLIGTLLLILATVVLPTTVEATEYNSSIENVEVLEDGKITEVNNSNPHERTLLITEDNGEEYHVTMNYETNQLFIDGVEIYTEIATEENIKNTIMPFATFDRSTGVTVSHKIPWKGSVTLLAGAIAGLISGGSAAGWATTIAGALTADAKNLWVRYTQYKSKENYYSNYHGTYYKKARNMNIKFYKTSIASKNLIYGPVNGSWFDPIRP